MKNLKRTGYKTLLTSLAALVVFSNVSLHNVLASEEDSPDEKVEQEVTEDLVEEVEDTTESEVTEEQEVVEQIEIELSEEVVEVGEQEELYEEERFINNEEDLNENDLELLKNKVVAEERFQTSAIISETYTYNILLIDDATGTTIAETTITGNDYTVGLNNFINNYNSQNSMDLELLSHYSFETGSSSITIGNRIYRSIAETVRATVIDNTEYVDEEDEITNTIKPPFLPPSTIYDDTDRSRYYRTINIVYNGRELHSETYITFLTVDQSIMNAMESINSDLYYFNSVSVSSGWTSIVSSSFQYTGPTQTVTVYVNQYDPVLDNVSEEVEQISFETIYNENNNVPIGEKRVVQEGVNGSITTITTTRTHYGEQIGEPVVLVETVDPINEIIEIGTGEVEVEVNVYEEVIPFEVEYVNNSELLIGEDEVSQEGVDGILTVTEEITIVGGQEYNRKVLEEEVTLEPLNQIVQVGTKAVFEETKTEEIAFEVELVDNPELLVGTEEVSQEGVAGVRTIVEEVTTVEDEETERVVLSSEVTTEPVNQVIQVGSKAAIIEDNATTVTEETRTEEVPFEVVYEDNPELEVGTKEVSQEGVNGVRTIVEEVTTVGGEETNREVVSEEVTTEPINQVIQVGTKSVTEETRTEEVPFEVVYEDNPELQVGTEEISQEGVNGVRTIVESVTTVGGEETNREVISDEVTTEPINQVVQVGTKGAETDEGETPVVPGDGSGSDEGGSEVVPAPPADSGVSESDDSSQQEMLPETGTALTNTFAGLAGLLLAMGAAFIFFTRRKSAVK